MSKRRDMKIGTLRKRGWTNELITGLLPKPRVVTSYGHTFRVWKTSDVLAAEETEEYKNNRVEHVTPKSAESTVRIPASQLFDASWASAEKDDSNEWTLAGFYHAAIVSRLSSAEPDPP